MVDDALLGAAAVFTIAFAVVAWAGNDAAAAWMAGGLAAVAIARVVTLVTGSFTDEF